MTALRLVHDGMYISCIRGAAAPTSSTTQVHVKRADVFRIGEHAFPASDVCSNGRFRGDIWTGPPRAAVRPVFDRWTRHLLAGLAPSRGWHTLLHRASRLASCRADTHSFVCNKSLTCPGAGHARKNRRRQSAGNKHGAGHGWFPERISLCSTRAGANTCFLGWACRSKGSLMQKQGVSTQLSVKSGQVTLGA